ncbi:hypothetical protein [Krasilnikovia sp. MM14-A1259]|uniref:hypothetical protein n=1 Tax=Krasilnikovia sp. MM14-A1259 TaxID=3373539 RepID=UPI00399C9235
MVERVEHWFNRRYGMARHDVYLVRTATGWQVLGRVGGAEGREVLHYFDQEGDARAMLRRMLETVPPELSSWAEMTAYKNRPS